jgi:spore maturation protein CgeB
MKIMLFWSYYDAYIQAVYAEHLGLDKMSYKKQQDVLSSGHFGWPPDLAKQWIEQGHEVEILIVNAEHLQTAWAAENDISFDIGTWQYEIAYEQVKQFTPDILWIGSMFNYFGEYLRRLKPFCQKIFAWTACPVPRTLDLSGIDCMLTSHENYKNNFIRLGKKCEKVLPAFDPQILDELKSSVADIDCSFVGNLSWAHIQRIRVMKQLADRTPIQIWGDRPRLKSRGLLKKGFIPAYLEARSIKSRIRPAVWGMEMYEILARSAMTVNVHGEVAEGLAGNMRMFEATGVGSLLLTESAPNIKELYEPGEEVITYRDTEHLVDIISYYNSHPQERDEIAAAGQRKTFMKHSVAQRSSELLDVFEVYLGQVTV